MIQADTKKCLRYSESEESCTETNSAWDIDDLIFDEFATITVSDR